MIILVAMSYCHSNIILSVCRDGLKLQTLGMIPVQKKKETNKVKQPEKGHTHDYYD